jgi:carbon storage regulator CsrA
MRSVLDIPSLYHKRRIYAMLILTRRTNDPVDLYYTDETGTERKISVMVLSIRDGVMRLGVDAPRDVLILRREVKRKDMEHGV